MPTLKLTAETLQLKSDNPEFFATCIAGLRSGLYTQFQGAMCDPQVHNSACCLHVMEMECNMAEWEDGLNDKGRALGTPAEMNNPFLLDGELLPEDVMRAEHSNGSGGYGPDEWNDTLGLTFNQIAYLLENGTLEF